LRTKPERTEREEMGTKRVGQERGDKRRRNEKGDRKKLEGENQI
jgi:hypothetical protein